MQWPRGQRNPELTAPSQKAAHSTRERPPPSNLTTPMLSNEKIAVPKKRG
jgi:hypothetical protein